MSAQHTPGDWAIDADDIAQSSEDIFTIGIWGPGVGDDRVLVATVSAFSLASRFESGTQVFTTDSPEQAAAEEAKANARLIAAAPKLLDCVRNSAMNATGDRRMRYLAAIAEAEGGAP